MAFANLNIELSANLQKLQGDLDKAATLSQQAAAKIQKSADGAGQALGDAANAADFAGLSKEATAAASSMDQIKTSAAGTGTALDKAKEQLRGLLSSIQDEASTQFDKLAEKGKVAGLAISIGIGLLLAGTVAGAVYGAYKLIKETAGFIEGLFTGSSYKSKYIDSLVEADNKVKDLRRSLAITATSASALGLALDKIGVPKDDFVSVYTATESAIRKVQQALEDAKKSGDADAITKAQANAFDRLGVVYKDANGKLLDYQLTVQNASKVLDSFTAGYDRNAAAAELGIGSAEKVANAAKLNAQNFGEAGQRLKDYYLVIGPGAQEAVDRYQTAMRDFRVESDLTSEGFKRAIADATIPTLTDLAELLKDGFPSAVEGFRGALTGVVTVLEGFKIGVQAVYEIVAFSFSGMQIAVSASLNAIDKALHFDFTGAKKEVEEGTKAIEARFNQMLDNVSGNLAKALKNIDLASGKDSTLNIGGARDKTILERQGGGKAYVPPPASGAKPAAASNVDLEKKLLDQQLKILDLFIAEEKEQLASRDTYLQEYYQRDEVSIADYFGFRKTAQADFTAKQRAAYAEEIADIEKYIASKKGSDDPKNQASVIEQTTRLKEVQAKQRKAESDAADRSIKDWFAEAKAVEQYGDKLNSLVAQIKATNQDTAGAFEIDFEAQNRSLKKQLKAVLDSDSSTQADRNKATQGIIDLDQLRQEGLARAKLNDLDSKRNDILGALQNAQDRINIAVSSGAATELEGLQAASKANADRVASLTKVVDAYEAIAKASGDPTAIVQADALRVQLERLAMQTDLVADKFNEIGKSAGENFLDKLTSGTVKLKDALKGLFADLNSQILKLANKNIVETLFKKDGGTLGDFGKTISQFIGGSTSGSSAGAVAGAGGSVGAGASGNSLVSALAAVFGGSKASGAPGAGLKSGDTGAFDQTGSAGTEAATTAANDAAFKSLTGTVSDAQSAISSFSLQGIGGATKSFGDYVEKTIFGTAIEETASSTTSTAAISVAALATAADSAAAALFQVAASSAGSSGGGDALGSFIGTLASAKGNVFSGGSVLPFARGGVVSSPTIFPMANGGTGLMGEAGPEAIMPLKRGRNGELGVAVDGARGAAPVTHIYNVTVEAPPNGDRRSASQHGAEIARQLQIASARHG